MTRHRPSAKALARSTAPGLSERSSALFIAATLLAMIVISALEMMG